jgi:hypothetical protein
MAQGVVVAVQIFVSYARDDDALPPGAPPNKGFVSFLCDQLIYEFTRIGPTRPKLWRDIERIEKGEEFAKKFDEQLATSALMLIVLSRNWLARPWCSHELELFAGKREKHSDAGVRKRIVFAAKHFISFDRRPALIQGKEGYDFFSLDGDGDDGDGNCKEREYFDRGAVRDEKRYYERVGELGRYLYQLAQQYDCDGHARAAPAAGVEDAKRPNTAGATKPSRAIYVAQPAADMRQAYDRVVAELQKRGFTVVPQPGLEIPKDETAVKFIDGALGEADLSVHLLGERLGYAPEDADPILKLQLARAAARIAAARTAPERGDFFRLIWAPRVSTGEGVATAEMRDPLAVLAKVDRQLDMDKIEGDSLSKFIDFLIQRVDRTEIPKQMPELLESDTRVYINHRIEDTENAIQFGKALAEHQIQVLWPYFEGDPAELRAMHHENLRDANAVLLCWAKAPEVWVSKSAQELRSWRDLGRTERFGCRLLVAAPPPGLTKRRLLNVPPRSDIDAVLDLTNCDEPPPHAFDSLIRASRLQET